MLSNFFNEFLVNIFKMSAAMSFVDYLCLGILWFWMLVMTDFWDDFAFNMSYVWSGNQNRSEEFDHFIMGFQPHKLFSDSVFCLKFWILFWFSPLILFRFSGFALFSFLRYICQLPFECLLFLEILVFLPLNSNFYENLV